jgi:hypothetical protein
LTGTIHRIYGRCLLRSDWIEVYPVAVYVSKVFSSVTEARSPVILPHTFWNAFFLIV